MRGPERLGNWPKVTQAESGTESTLDLGQSQGRGKVWALETHEDEVVRPPESEEQDRGPQRAVRRGLAAPMSPAARSISGSLLLIEEQAQLPGLEPFSTPVQSPVCLS